jgi:hypothetical protein
MELISHILDQPMMEDAMPALKSLTFTTMPVIGANPTVDRRANIIARLEEQKRLLNDPKYTRTIKTKAGEKQQKVLPWFDEYNGAYYVFVRSGLKKIEFEKGKSAIAVPSRDKIAGVIDTLMTAVRNGEQDDKIAPVKKPPTLPKSKKVA